MIYSKNLKNNYPNILLALSRYDYRTHRGVAKFAAEHHWHLNCEMAISGNIPYGWQGDGIVSLLSNNNEVVDFVTNAGVPFVDLSILREDIKAPRVTADNQTIGKIAAEYFLARGYKHFAFFSATDDKVAAARKNSFFAVLKTTALSMHDWTMRNTQGSWTDKNQILLRHLHSAHFPLAIFATRDLDASIILEACINEDMHVPEQVAILGVDNNELITDSLQVPLSSVNHNVESLGYEGAKLLHRILQGEALPSTSQTIAPKGVTSRRSTDSLAVNDPQVKHALNHMKDNFNNKYYSVELASDVCQLTRRTLDNKFKQELGHSMHNELQHMRMRAAKEMLMHSDKSIFLIAKECGFNTAQYFNQFFKQQYGITPLVYRKNYE
ncbi:MAG: substrate-binding domain-containing protein [Thalassotalea sp.]